MSRDVPWGDEVVETSWEVSEGTIAVPDGPGLVFSSIPKPPAITPENRKNRTVCSTRKVPSNDPEHIIAGQALHIRMMIVNCRSSPT